MKMLANIELSPQQIVEACGEQDCTELLIEASLRLQKLNDARIAAEQHRREQEDAVRGTVCDRCGKDLGGVFGLEGSGNCAYCGRDLCRECAGVWHAVVEDIASGNRAYQWCSACDKKATLLDADKKQQEIAASNARILKENTENSVNDVRKWSKHDDDYLRRCYGDVAVSVGDMAGAMQRTVRAVRERANQLGLKRPAGKQMSEQAKAHKAACVAANGGVKGAWTEEEKTLLRQTYPNPDYTTEDIAQMLGRTVMALHHPDAMPFCNTACPLIKRSRQNSQQKVSAT